MNIYGFLQVVAADLPDGAERAEALNLVDLLERQNAFGTIAKVTTAVHRWTQQAPGNPRCGFCGKYREEHES